MPDVETPPEARYGWQTEGASSQRRFHFIDGHESLCRKFGFYFGAIAEGGLTAGTPGVDCADCLRRVDKLLEQKKALEVALAAIDDDKPSHMHGVWTGPSELRADVCQCDLAADHIDPNPER